MCIRDSSKAVNELVRLHVIDTFGVAMSPLTPWRRSGELLVDSPLLQGLDDLHPTSFTFDPTPSASPDRVGGATATLDRVRPAVPTEVTLSEEERS